LEKSELAAGGQLELVCRRIVSHRRFGHLPTRIARTPARHLLLRRYIEFGFIDAAAEDRRASNHPLQGRWERAVAILDRLDPTVAADVFLSLTYENQQVLFRRFPVEFAAKAVADSSRLADCPGRRSLRADAGFGRIGGCRQM
jgi:hypothetical protein